MTRARLWTVCIGLVVFVLAAWAVADLATAERSLNAESTFSIEKPPPTGELTPPDPQVTKQGGDNVATAVVIPSLPFSSSGTTTGYTNDYDEVCPYTGSTAPDVVYSYTPTANEWIDVSLCQSLYDTKMYIYENAVIPGSPHACNDDACGSDGYKSELVGVPVTGGNTYYIVIDAYGTASGTYFLDVVVGEPPPDYCPVDTTIFGQSTHTPDYSGWSAGVSDVGFTDGPLLRYDYFEGLTTDIAAVHFWAISAYNPGSGWSECDETPRDLQIVFYQDDAGEPGTPVATFDVSVAGIPTAFLFSGFTLDEYRVELTSPVALSEGWLSIQGTDAATCWFLWMSGYGIDNQHYLLDATSVLGPEAGDLSFCLLGQIGEPTGACCYLDGSCAELTATECGQSGGTYQGDGTSCTPNPCPQYCCVGNTGNINDDIAGDVDLSDLIYMVDWLFNSGPAPACLAAANTNGDAACDADLSDLIHLVNYLFLQGAAPMPCDPNCE
ncbi:MAG: hypothetical protein RBT76_03905 [candidate division Zixibacteria bacterium]|jgi:hypothetical protein|nr:hypothetical protein [candidate division Zixibacteria bacterium]